MSLQTSTTVFSSDPILVLETLGGDSSQEDKGQRLCLPVISLRVSLASNRALQWTLANPNSLGPEPIQISEIFGLVKATAATCVIVTTPYLHSVLGSLRSLPLLHVHRTHNTAPKRSFSTLLLHLTHKT